MNNERIKNIVEKLSLFNNIELTRKQWEIILKGCGCPKSAHFWYSLRQENLVKSRNKYTLININTTSLIKVWEQYNSLNNEYVKRSNEKAKKRQLALERKSQFKGICFYMVNGCLTTEKPERD